MYLVVCWLSVRSAVESVLFQIYIKSNVSVFNGQTSHCLVSVCFLGQ